MALLIIAVLPLFVAAGLIAWPFWVERRRERIRSRPFPPAWRRILDRRVPLVARMPAALRRQLEGHVQVFVAEKEFVGCDGVAIDDEKRVTIAAQACLLLLNRRPDYFPKLRQVLVYPGAFAVENPRLEPSGVMSEERHVLSGESWAHGQVVLSWEDTLHGAAEPTDGQNVVIHEFAHQLDQQKGYANGAPWLGSRHFYPEWSRVMNEEFARLQWSRANGEPTLFNGYGATNPAEFFAVATEVFFEQPAALLALHPQVYGQLHRLYRVNPCSW